MTGEKSTDEKATVISASPIELRHNVVFVMCRNQLLGALNDCSLLEGDEVWKSLPTEQRNKDYVSLSAVEKQKLIERIIANIRDVKSTLWAAVVSANSEKRNDSNPEG